MIVGSDKLAYSIPESIRATSLSRTTIYELAKRGRLKITKVGGRSLILAADLRALLSGEAE